MDKIIKMLLSSELQAVITGSELESKIYANRINLELFLTRMAKSDWVFLIALD